MLEGYLKALAIREELVAATPGDAEGRAQLARIYASLRRVMFRRLSREGTFLTGAIGCER